MFFKLIRYDLRVGFASTYKRYLAALALFAVLFASFQLKLLSFNAFAAAEEAVDGTLGNALLFAFGGMGEYIPVAGEPFKFPAFWMLLYLLLSYITLYYPYHDLEEFGQQLLIRSGGRGAWWSSKCIWNVASVVCFFLLGWLVLFAGCLLTGNPITPQLSPGIVWVMQMGDQHLLPPPTDMLLQTLLLPLLVMVALNLFQMTLSLFIKPFYSYIVTVAILLISAYYLSPFLIGNYAMPLRSDQLVDNGVGLTAGILFSVALILLSVIVGWLVFRRRDILKREGDD